VYAISWQAEKNNHRESREMCCIQFIDNATWHTYSEEGKASNYMRKKLESSPIEPQGKSSSKHGRKRIRETNTHHNIHPCCPVALWPAQSHPRTPPAKPGLNLIRIWTNKNSSKSLHKKFSYKTQLKHMSSNHGKRDTHSCSERSSGCTI
jgi:hypothetical protein